EERHAPVTLISLNQPDRDHVLSYLLRLQLAEAMNRAEADSEVRAIVLTGTGQKAFCAGGDLKEMPTPR
ncbi:MAG: enoyl-CoA hydratase/isomerase family protein, partial [Chloroflexi bacterium]